jgi:hypothetical protein
MTEQANGIFAGIASGGDKLVEDNGFEGGGCLAIPWGNLEQQFLLGAITHH